MSEIKTIGVLTSGGDSPGMNAAIRAVVRCAIGRGINVKGIKKGYAGLIDGQVVDMKAEDVSGIIQRGGTILYTARSALMMTTDGQTRAVEQCKKHGLDALIVIGGDGSFKGAKCLADLGVNVVGIPGTIDLDIGCTEYSIGFDTAINTAMDAIDKIKDTSASHERCSIIEVMGRHAGYIALWCGIACGAEDIIIPETYNYDEQSLLDRIIDNRKRGRTHHIIVNAEGIGDSVSMARRIEAATGIETRATILGYMQRGGNPTCRDRMYASIMGEHAVRIIDEGAKNRVVVRKNDTFVDVDIYEALTQTKEVPEYALSAAKTLTYHYSKTGI